MIVCFNPMLAEERHRKRQVLLEATEKALDKLVKQVERRTKTPLSAAEIGRKVGHIIHRFKVAKHFETVIAEGSLKATVCDRTGRFSYQRRTEANNRKSLSYVKTVEYAAGADCGTMVREEDGGWMPAEKFLETADDQRRACSTGTLIFGYADDLFFLLWRILTRRMLDDRYLAPQGAPGASAKNSRSRGTTWVMTEPPGSTA